MLILQGCTPDEAAALLEQAGGRLRTALRLAGSASEIATEMPTLTLISHPRCRIRWQGTE